MLDTLFQTNIGRFFIVFLHYRVDTFKLLVNNIENNLFYRNTPFKNKMFVNYLPSLPERYPQKRMPFTTKNSVVQDKLKLSKCKSSWHTS